MIFPNMIDDAGLIRSEFLPNYIIEGSFVGDIRPVFFRVTKLPNGWYFGNGDKYPVASPQGLALLGLDAQFRSDLGIVSSGGQVNVPDLFDDDGFGFFVRGVDGETRQPGSRQQDAIRELEGTYSGFGSWKKTNPAPTGVFGRTVAHANTAHQGVGDATHQLEFMDIKASRAVPTADENRPKNIGAIFAIFLGA